MIGASAIPIELNRRDFFTNKWPTAESLQKKKHIKNQQI